jgi:hypothetical protein
MVGAARVVACALAMGVSITPPAPSTASAPESPLADLPPVERFAPLLLLAPGERALPANVEWYLARSRLDIAGGPVLATQVFLAERTGADAGRLLPAATARAGTDDPREWVTYAHAYRSDDGAWLLQYWFFYPFNDFHGLFDHEGDWEHLTVRLDARGEPLGAWYARHDSNAPGAYFAWSSLAREGDHPVALSARGSHALYTSRDDVAWYDETCPTTDLAAATTAGCRVWRTWSAGGVIETGSALDPAAGARFLLWRGRWGAEAGAVTDCPPGPAHQPGWCSGGDERCQ